MMLAALQHPTALRADHRPAGSVLADAARWAESPGAGDDGAVIGLELLTTEPAGRRDDGHDVAAQHLPCFAKCGHGPSRWQCFGVPQPGGADSLVFR
jgi:hypothetical protein